MSKKMNLLSLLALGLTVLSTTSSVRAEAAKPLVQLALASYDQVRMDVNAVSRVRQSPEMPVWLSSLLRLYAEGRDVRGIDRSKPWGAVIQRGEKLSAYGFVPVWDAETLAGELGEFIASRSEIQPGIFKVQGREPGQQLYATASGGWLFVSDAPETLASVPWDPARDLVGLNSQYDVAVRLQLKNIPAEAGEHILTELDKSLGPTLRQMSSDRTVELLGELAKDLDEVTLGWAKR